MKEAVKRDVGKSLPLSETNISKMARRMWSQKHQKEQAFQRGKERSRCTLELYSSRLFCCVFALVTSMIPC